jgi:undecaprenyl-diphosphatase
VRALLGVAVVGVLVFAAMLVAVDGGGHLGLDRAAFEAAGDLRSGGLTSVVKVVTALGSTLTVGLVVLAAAAVLAHQGSRLELVALVLGAALDVAAWNLVKELVARPRPRGALVDVGGFAFPSGHAANSVAYVAVAVALAHGVPRLGSRTGIVVAAVVLALAIGLSRVYLRAHYLSDVLGGWGLGAAVLSLSACAALLVTAVRHNVRAA